MMMEFLGQKPAADAIVAAMEATLRAGAVRTPDLGGQATTRDMAQAVSDQLDALC